MSIRFGTKIISGQTEIVDNLESTSPIKALSAKQGKVLKDTIDNIDIVWEEGEGEGSIISKSNTEGLGEATGVHSVAEGYNTFAWADNSHVEGNGNKIFETATGAHAEGIANNARGAASHVEGQQSTSNGACSHAEGGLTTAIGDYSHTEGNSTIANNNYEHAEGHFNKSNKTSNTYGDAGNTMHSIGIGNSLMNAKNAVEVMQNGDTYVIGIGDYDGTNFSEADTVQDVLNGKQEQLTAGDNITIDNNTISATDTTYSAGSNISIENGVISATDTTYSAGNGLSLNGNTFSANVINNTTSDSTTNSLSAAAGKSLQDQINNLNARGKYLSIWNCTTGLAMDEPPVNPYTVETGSYFIIGVVGTTNYRPNGGIYNKDVPSTTIETEKVKPNDTYYYDGTTWRLLSTPVTDVAFSTLAGSPYDNTNLANALNSKQATISDLVTIRSNASAGKIASNVIETYGNIVTHDADEFATSSQGSKADTALQPGDNISDLTNDSNYQTGTQVSTTVNTHNTSSTAHSTLFNAKQDKLESGTNIKTINSTSLLGSGNITVQSTITGGASTITSSNLVVSRALVSNTSGKVAVSDITSTELGYLDGVTSNVQTQLNNKLPNTTKYAKSISYSGSTLTLKDQDGTSLSTATIKSSPDLDNQSITTNSDDELQTIGVIDSSDSSTAIKVWTGELADLPAVKDPNTLYNVTDDFEGGGSVYTKDQVDALLDEKANNSSVLHTTGNETATGTKTLSLGSSTATTQGTSDNSTKVATTAYINNKFQLVSALPSNPDSNVWYAIPE